MWASSKWKENHCFFLINVGSNPTTHFIFILNTLVKSENKKITILLSSESDIIGVFVIIKNFACKFPQPNKIYVITEDYKLLKTWYKEDLFLFQNISLNKFLSYYIGRLATKEYDTQVDKLKVIGWEFNFSSNISFNDAEKNLIEQKVIGFKNKKIIKTID